MIFGLLAAGLGLGGGILSGMGQRREAHDAANLRRTEARMAQAAALDAYRRGAMEAGAARHQTSRLLGQQTLLGGASGLDMGSSAIAAAGTTTRFFGELDAATIEENAIREAFGMLQQSDVLIRQARSFRTQKDWAVPMGILSGLSFAASAVPRDLFTGGSAAAGGGGFGQLSSGIRPVGSGLNLGNFYNRLRFR